MLTEQKLEKLIIRGLIFDPIFDHCLLDNFSAINKSTVRLRDTNAIEVYNYIEKFFGKSGEFPQVESLQNHFTALSNRAVISFLDDVMAETFPKKGDFENYLSQLYELYIKKDMTHIIKESAEILQSGKTLNKKLFKGNKDCADFLIHKISRLQLNPTSTKVSGDIREDASQQKLSYLQKKSNPTDSLGIFTKLDKLDEITRGTHRGELLIIAAFVAQYKTTLCLNIAQDAVSLGYNVLLFSLEMPYEQVSRILYTIHANSGCLGGKHTDLSYDSIKTGTLNPEQEDYYLNKVLPDFSDNPQYGKLIVQQVDTDDMTLAKIEATAELYNKETPLDLIIIDYATLLRPSKDLAYKDKKDAINQIVQDLKMLALRFNGGKAIPIISPVQINREGWKLAQKNEGVYTLTAIGEFNAIEKAADVIISIYADEEFKSRKEAKITVLKNRDGRIPPPFVIYANGDSKILSSISQEIVTDEDGLADLDFG